MGWGPFSNPANWGVTDFAQGQAGGDPTPGFNLGITSAVDNITHASPSSVGLSPGSNSPAVQTPATGVGSTGDQGALQNTLANDPYAAYGGQANYNALTGQINSSLSNIRQGGTDAFGNAFLGYQGTAQDDLNSIRDTQTGIDNSRNTNELNRQNGIQDILGYVRNGLQQGASRLAANNATESSATGALGRAYQQIGSQKVRAVNSGAGLQNAQLDQSQSQLQQHIADTTTDLHRQRDTYVNQIGSDVRDKLAQLDTQAQGLSLPGRIAVDQEKQNIVNAGMQQLQGVDQWFQSQIGGVSPETQDQQLTAVQGLRGAGTALSNPFSQQFDQQQVQGPAVDQLPLFTRNKKTTG